MAGRKKNWRIHAYRAKDNLVPFEWEAEFASTIREPLGEAIWSIFKAQGVDNKLLVEDHTYKYKRGVTGARVGIIKCATDNGRTKICALLQRIGLGLHFRPTERPEIRGTPMTFRKPSPAQQTTGSSYSSFSPSTALAENAVASARGWSQSTSRRTW
jgi:hypothetical protein